jgi:hypothetical protein
VTEAKLRQRIAKRLRSHGAFVRTIHGGPNQPALLDLVGCYEGKFFTLEVKLPGKERTLTERQKSLLRQAKEAGGISEMVTTVKEALEAVGCVSD